MRGFFWPFASLLLSTISYSQVITLEGQLFPQSCWAASLSMAAKYVSPESKELSQCFFIDKEDSLLLNPQCCCCMLPDSIFDLDNNISNNEVCHNAISAQSFNTVSGLAKLISTNKYEVDVNVDLSFLSKRLSEGLPSPLIYFYAYKGNLATSPGSTANHFTLIDSLLRIGYGSNSSSSQYFLRVKDPWPQLQGTEYFMSYERFWAQDIKRLITFRDPGNLEIGPETASYIEKVKLSFSSNPDALIENFLERIKEIPEESNKIFLQQCGLPLSNLARSTLTLGDTYNIEKLQCDTVIANGNKIAIIGVNSNKKLFEEKLTTVLSETNVQSVFTASRKIAGDLMDSTWFIGNIEIGDRYKSLGNIENLRIFFKNKCVNPKTILKIYGEVNAEYLVEEITPEIFRVAIPIIFSRESLSIPEYIILKTI